MLKRAFDLIAAVVLLVLLLPVFIFLAAWIGMDSRGGVFFVQQRVGKNNRDFGMIKFRTMYVNAESSGPLTIGNRDPRITRAGYYLRKYKLDELPQLVNVLKGDMSLVGPRPEVRKYVELYSEEQKQVLQVRPGITDYASIEFADENQRLAACPDPEQEYINVIMPAKLKLNLRYIQQHGLATDIRILIKTIFRILALSKRHHRND